MRAERVFGALAIVLGVAIIVAALVGVLVTPWVTIGASLLGILWLAVVKRRPPHRRAR
jgi:hypothetical protein